MRKGKIEYEKNIRWETFVRWNGFAKKVKRKKKQMKYLKKPSVNTLK